MESFFTLDRSLEMLGFLIGLLYLWWEYHADARMWWASLAMPLISFWVYYRAGLYADFAMNIYYFAIAIYGYIAWTRNSGRGKGAAESGKSGKSARPITHVPPRVLAGCAAAFATVYGLIAWWLITCTDSTVPWLDAFTTAMSIVATWMLAQKYLEQWVAWVFVDAVCVGLYFYKDRPFYAILYAIYTVIAILGYRKWRRMMREGV